MKKRYRKEKGSGGRCRCRKRLCFFVIIFLLAGLFYTPGTAAAGGQKSKTLTLYAKSAALMDGENLRLLYGKDPELELPMASTTKIMTLLVTLENADLTEEVTFSERAAAMPDVQLNAKAGDVFLLEDLCYALMLESYNDVAVAIAEHVGGSVEDFAVLMNQKAKELGMTHTHFVTPNGLDADGHYSTAKDLCLLGAYAIQNPKFLEIIQMQVYGFQEQRTKQRYSVRNKDAFLTQYDGAVGIKTGFTGKAGYCFVGAVKKDDRTLISAVLASGWPPDKTRKWSDTGKLMDYGCEEYQKKECGLSEITLSKLRVKDGTQPDVSVAADVHTIEVLLGEKEQVTVKKQMLRTLDAPVEQGKSVGTIQYLLNGEVLEQFPIYTTETVKKRDYGYWLTKVLRTFFVGKA